MKRLKRLSILILIWLVGFGFLFLELQQVKAEKYDSEKVIWNRLSRKEKEGLLELCQHQVFAIGLTQYTYSHEGKTVKLDFSKASKRRYILKWYDMNSVYGGIDCNVGTLSKRLFGTGTPNIRTITGDVGDETPYIDYTGHGDPYVRQIGSNKYLYTANISVIDEAYGQSLGFAGSAEFTLKKKPGSYYGWIVKSVKLDCW